MAVCTSIDCEKYRFCKHSAYFTTGTHIACDYANEGTGYVTQEKTEIVYSCGPRGHYKYFEAVKPKEDVNTVIEGLTWCVRCGDECVFKMVDCPFVEQCKANGNKSLKQAALNTIVSQKLEIERLTSSLDNQSIR